MNTETTSTPTFDEVEFSPTLGKLFEALSAAQGEMDDATKDAANPFYKSNYADLASVRSAIKEPFAKHKIATTQWPISREGRVGVVTILGHSSGEWIRGYVFAKPAKDDVQATGSTITYLRRYSLQAAACIAADDDDGEGAMGRDTKTEKRSSSNPSPASGKSAPTKSGQITPATLKAIADLRKAEEGERLAIELLSHWKLVDFDQCSEKEGQEALKWITAELKSVTKGAA